MTDDDAGFGRFYVAPTRDGSVEFGIASDKQIIATTVLSPSQVGEVASQLLRAAHSSFQATDLEPQDIPFAFQISNPISIHGLMIGTTKTQGQHVIAIRTGQTDVGFIVDHKHLRSLARSCLRASWTVQSVRLPLRTRFLDAFRLFVSELRECGGVFSARLKASFHCRAISWSERISGRSLRLFRTIDVSSAIDPPRYAAANRCIYCDAQVYSSRPGDREYPFGAEHIIAEGLGGNLEIPEASCRKCEDATGRFVEGDVLGRTLKALRVHLKLKKSGSGPAPKTLPIDATIEDERHNKMELPVEDYPVVFMMPVYPRPSFIADATSGSRTMVGAKFVQLKYDQRTLFRKYRITGFASPHWDNLMLTRMLAKIGHSLAAAELGLDKFKPLLCDLIRRGHFGAAKLVGGDPVLSEGQPASVLHSVGLGYQRNAGKIYVVAQIRLFAAHGGPVYLVVVGESLESPMARFKRRFFRKISAVLAR